MQENIPEILADSINNLPHCMETVFTGFVTGAVQSVIAYWCNLDKKLKRRISEYSLYTNNNDSNPPIQVY